MIVRALAVLSLVAMPAAAQQPAAIQLDYAGYSSGFNVMDLQASIALSPESYSVKVSYHLTGLIGALIHFQSSTAVDGRFRGNQAEPRELFSAGRWRGEDRVTQIDWRNGSPIISQLIPPVEAERDPVPPEEQAHTIDSLSAMAALLHEVGASGRCEGAMNTFDGRRLSAVEAHTAGEETLAPTDRSSFRGPALRCDFEGRQLAGFVHDSDIDELRRPQHGSAWFARLSPGGPMLPVRISFAARRVGEITMYLKGGS